MKKYRLSNSFYNVLLINETDIDINSLKKYFYNYISVEECNDLNNADTILLIKKKYSFVNYDIKYTIDNHILYFDRNDCVVLLLDNSDSEVIFLKRFIIDLMNRIIEKNGGIFLHGSTLVNNNNNKSIIFTGESNSGKTTNMLRLLEKSQFDYSSNERVALIRDDNEIYSVGCPSNINVRINTLRYNDSIFNKLCNYIDFNEYKIKTKICNNSIDTKLNFTALQISNSFNKNIKPIGNIRCICDLNYVVGHSFVMKELSEKEKLSVLKENLISGVYSSRKDVFKKILLQEKSIDFRDFTDIKYYNIYHDNKDDNIEKILKLVKEDIL